MADLEDALKRLDRLTQEEARMALAEVLRITHSIRGEVKVVDGKVEIVENKVEDIRDRVQDVIDGTCGMSSQPLVLLKAYTLRWQASKRRGEGSEIDDPTSGRRNRRNQVFVTTS